MLAAAALGLVALGSLTFLFMRSDGATANPDGGIVSVSAPPAGPASAGPLASAGTLVVTAQVYDPTGQPDNADQVWHALGTNPRSGWSTDTYRQPFPALKPGVGIMVGFAAPVQLSALTVTSPSIGSQLEIRSALSPVAPLDHTTMIATSTLRAGDTVISVAGSQPVQHVLIWITKLGGGGDANVTQISNLHFDHIAD